MSRFHDDKFSSIHSEALSHVLLLLRRRSLEEVQHESSILISLGNSSSTTQKLKEMKALNLMLSSYLQWICKLLLLLHVQQASRK